jgi:hypothetical protein
VTVAEVVLQIVLSIVLTAAVVRRDERRLGAEQLARAWNYASFWTAVVVFGPLCIPVHFLRVRRSVAGLGLGLLWMVAVFAALAGGGALVGELLS